MNTLYFYLSTFLEYLRHHCTTGHNTIVTGLHACIKVKGGYFEHSLS